MPSHNTLGPIAAASPWSAAVAAHAYLLTHPHLPPTTHPAPAVDLVTGELVVGVLDAHTCGGMAFARWANTTITYHHPGTVIAGSPQFVAGYLLGTLALRAHTRRRAHRDTAPRWWTTPLRCTVVTTHRLWCHITEPHRTPRWISLAHQHITDLTLAGQTLTASYGTRCEPLQLTGPWAPWCAAVMAHHRYGPHAPTILPTLHTAALAH